MKMSEEKNRNNLRLVGYGFGGVNLALVAVLPAQFLMVFFTNTAFLDIAVISVILGVSRIFDGISDILVGNIIDNTRSRYGKAKIWIARMCVPFAVSMVLLFAVPSNWPEFAKYVYVFITYNLFMTVFSTFMIISQSSLMVLISDNMAERGKMSSVYNLFYQLCKTIVGAAFVKLLILFSDDAANPHTQRGYLFTVSLFGIMSVIASLILFFSTKERNVDGTDAPGGIQKNDFLTDIKILLKNKYWVIMMLSTVFTFIGNILAGSSASYYTIYILHDFNAMELFGLFPGLAGITATLILSIIKTPAEKSRIYVAAHFILVAGIIAVFLAGDNRTMLIAALLLQGLGMGCASASLNALMAESIEVSSRQSGKLIVGVGFAGMNAVQKFTMGASTAVYGAIMSASGFDARLDSQGIMQPESVISAIRLCFFGVPIVCYLIIALMFLFLFDIRKVLKD